MDLDSLRQVLGEVNLPSWIQFPDFERVGWFNLIIQQMWCAPVVEVVCTQMWNGLVLYGDYLTGLICPSACCVASMESGKP